MDFLPSLTDWDGLGAVIRWDAPTGTWVFIAMHDDTLGPPVGGCRMNVYDRPEDGLRDALRLAEGMTHKWAAIDFPFGGGKSVLAVPEPLEGERRRGLLHRFGALLNTLEGAYGAGEDLGTTPADMLELASVTPHVVGVPGGPGGEPVDPGPFTALGVHVGMRAALAHRTESGSLLGRSVLIQGVGDVGRPLAEMVVADGGVLLICDMDAERARTAAEELGGSVVPMDDLYDTPCDVYAPCAVGATLSAETIPRLRCEIVAGSANNQLEEASDAGRLMDRGILYAPDYIINAGGAMAFGLLHQGVTDPEELQGRVSQIGDSLRRIFTEAAELGESPLAAAQARVTRILSRGRQATRAAEA